LNSLVDFHEIVVASEIMRETAKATETFETQVTTALLPLLFSAVLGLHFLTTKPFNAFTFIFHFCLTSKNT
jgi:hypothetical protein